MKGRESGDRLVIRPRDYLLVQLDWAVRLIFFFFFFFIYTATSQSQS